MTSHPYEECRSMMSASDDSMKTVAPDVSTDVTDVVPKGIEFISDYDANFFPPHVTHSTKTTIKSIQLRTRRRAL